MMGNLEVSIILGVFSVNSLNNADKHAIFYPRTWAKIIAKQTWRISVDFPPIFGPVKSMNGAWFSPPRLISFGTKHWPSSRLLSRIGCLNPFAISNGADLSEWQQITGLQVVPIIQLLAIERLMRASSSAKQNTIEAPVLALDHRENTSSGKCKVRKLWNTQVILYFPDNPKFSFFISKWTYQPLKAREMDEWTTWLLKY